MTFLLTWNPAKWSFPEKEYDDNVAATRGLNRRIVGDRWSLGSRRRVVLDERVFLLRQGPDRRGIVASGHTTSTAYEAPHWDGGGATAWYADVAWDRFAAVDDRLPTEVLTARVPSVDWHPQAGGQALEDDEAAVVDALWTGKEAFDERGERADGLAAEARQDAAQLLRRLLGVPLEGLTRRSFTVVSVVPPAVEVTVSGTNARRVTSLQAMQDALDELRDGDGFPLGEAPGWQEAFLAAALRTLPGVRTHGTPPFLLTLGRPRPELGGADEQQAGFDGELTRLAVGAQRGEQAALRARLFGGRDHDICDLCGKRYPVQFLRAAHIKRRSLCEEREQRDLDNIAMRACVFGCDSLYESGYVTVDPSGAVSVVEQPGAVGEYLAHLRGRDCPAATAASRPYFRWHERNVFRG